VRAAIDAAGHPALLVVDAVASLRRAPLAMDDQRFDVVLGASQKGLMLPPGLGFVASRPPGLAERAATRRRASTGTGAAEAGAMPYQKFCGTPPLNLLAGMEAGASAAVRRRAGRGLRPPPPAGGAGARRSPGWSREAVRVGFLCPDPAARSVSVTAIATTPGVDPDAIRRVAREQFDVSIAGGLGPLAGRVFRIGHLGDVNAPMLLGALAGVEAALTLLKVPYGRDGVAAAVDAIARAADDTAGTG
jgi:alanine-glyoxylate transaminase/serine-glyoxylate transaminase/serine-pyruvate transaminase